MKILNLLLPLIWMALTGDASLGNFLLGFLLTSLVLAVTAPAEEVVLLVLLLRLWAWLGFFLFFAWELLLSSLRVVHDILTPRHRMRPAIIAIPLDLDRDEQITLLANLLTLTPGSLSLEVAPGRDVLYVHAMYVDDVEAFRRAIKEKFESRVRRVLP